ncbi:hypothetical protein Tsubulata_034956 [Turnera subulata]|uniref:WW domain-containing protein n=1 Tax=Turnera subulata TaxID=218843 RepID=A0A9Q0G077_9ROSI|nr:hypothetical protein Tsubulata_042753 [Turnera subulata]KAJ4845319.1 hypothetical protein Tsubulata_034956 [Turnera subulata]
MVSFQAPTSPNWRKRILELDDHAASKKRKLWEETQPAVGFLEKKSSKSESTNSVFEIELHLETPLPFEWQRCLDIQSGQIHFYNTRTHKRTSKDPRKSTEPSSPDHHHHHHHMSLDLELNLQCESQRKNQAVVLDHHLPKDRNSNSISGGNLGDLLKDCSRDDRTKKPRGGLSRCPSWLAFEREQQEMVATVCTRCHMLVMLSKSSLACPNCKFVHPPDQTPPQLSKPRLSLLC